MQRLRILTFNIAHGRGLTPIQGLTLGRKLRANLRKIARLITELSPDVVALQEIDQNSRWAGNFDHLEYLQVHTGYPYSIFGINNKRAGLLNLNYGNAFLSKHPIVESENIVFGARTVGEKGFLFVEVDVGGNRRVPLLNLHLHYRSRVHRFRQVGKVMDYVAERIVSHAGDWHMLPIVCGDMNNQAHLPDATAELLRYFSLHGDYTLHPKGGRTFPSPFPSRGLDFIYLPPGCADVQCEVVRTMISDHRPVWAEFTLQEDRKTDFAPGGFVRHT
ncbi:MAG: endonuclease/exonuclease/phosphatase family protein [Opitutaceae bacterium]|nr:endonuclease/exonuclease/phosphatase family protein [Cephaloticoccus sp.]MCP5530132.1 endonuclease/exonuclease/phosphatase family protein [Opitutaceae bacterium]